MNDLIRFHVPAKYILDRVYLSGPETGLGFERGWLQPGDVVDIALAKLKAGIPLMEAEEQLALLLPQDFGDVSAMAQRLNISDQPLEERQRVWLYLVLGWLFDHRSEVRDPYELIALLSDDFGHPEEIHGVIYLVPPLPENPHAEMEERWRQYLERERARYEERNKQVLRAAGRTGDRTS